MDKAIIREQLKEIATIVKELVQHEYLYLDKPIKIKLTPHTPETNLWGICVSPADVVYVSSLETKKQQLHNGKWVEKPEEEWHQVEACDRSADTIIPSIYQRVKLLKQDFHKKTT